MELARICLTEDEVKELEEVFTTDAQRANLVMSHAEVCLQFFITSSDRKKWCITKNSIDSFFKMRDRLETQSGVNFINILQAAFLT